MSPLVDALLPHKTKELAFVTDIGVFCGVALSVAIPLSYGIIAKIGENFSSESIVELFRATATYRVLPILLLTNVIAAVAIRSSDKPSEILLDALFVSFIVSAFWILSFVRVIASYADSSSLAKRLIGRLRAASSKESLSDFAKYCEALRSVLAFETNLKAEEVVSEVVREFVELSTLCLTNGRSEHDQLEQLRQVLIITFNVQSLAVSRQCEKIATQISKQMLMLLDRLLEKPQNLGSVMLILERLNLQLQELETTTAKTILIEWPSLVWDFAETRHEYRSKLTYSLFLTLSSLANRGDIGNFDHCLQLIAQKIKFDQWPFAALSDLHLSIQSSSSSMPNCLESDFARLMNERHFFSADDYEDWTANFDLVMGRTDGALCSADILTNIAKVRVQMEQWYWRCRFMDLMFSLGSSLNLRKNSTALKTLLELHQAPNSFIKQVGTDLLPTNLQEATQLFLERDYIQSMLLFNPDFGSDMRRANRRFYLMILAHLYRFKELRFSERIDMSLLSDAALQRLRTEAPFLVRDATFLPRKFFSNVGIKVNGEIGICMSKIFQGIESAVKREEHARAASIRLGESITKRIQIHVANTFFSSFHLRRLLNWNYKLTIRYAAAHSCRLEFLIEKRHFKPDSLSIVVDEKVEREARHFSRKIEKKWIESLLFFAPKVCPLSSLPSLLNPNMICLVDSEGLSMLRKCFQVSRQETLLKQKYSAMRIPFEQFLISGQLLTVFRIDSPILQRKVILWDLKRGGAFSEKFSEKVSYIDVPIPSVEVTDLASKPDILNRIVAANNFSSDDRCLLLTCLHVSLEFDYHFHPPSGGLYALLF